MSKYKLLIACYTVYTNTTTVKMRSDSERERERERHIQTEPYQINVVMWLFALCERQRFRKIDKNKVKKKQKLYA